MCAVKAHGSRTCMAQQQGEAGASAAARQPCLLFSRSLPACWASALCCPRPCLPRLHVPLPGALRVWRRGCGVPPAPAPPGWPCPGAGNAWTDASTENQAAVTFWYSHGITSRTATRGMRDNCDFSRIGPLAQQASGRAAPPACRLLSCRLCAASCLCRPGNALTDPETDSRGALAFWWSHGDWLGGEGLPWR